MNDLTSTQTLFFEDGLDLAGAAGRMGAAIDSEELLKQIAQFFDDEVSTIGKLFGLSNVSVLVGRKWEMDLETGEITVDPKSFVDRNFSINDIENAIIHELVRLADKIRDPKVMQQYQRFVKAGQAQEVFAAIFMNIHDDKYKNALLPHMQDVDEHVYRQHIMADTNLTSMPRHYQFLYKIIKEEMLPCDGTLVSPEVRELIASFRNFKGSGQDLIKYSTQYAKSPTELMPLNEKYDVWMKVIYPKWQKLLAKDRADYVARKGDSSNDQESGFTDSYKDFKQRFPNAMSFQEQAQIDQAIADYTREQTTRERSEAIKDRREADPDFRRAEQFMRETGHSLADIERYNAEVEQWRETIDDLRDVLRKTLNENVHTHRRLTGGHNEGAILTPEHLARTAVDLRLQRSESPAFSDYNRRISDHKLSGKTDFVFAFDCSRSMFGERAKNAATSALICLEALAGMQRDISEAEERVGFEIDVDIRSALYTFGEGFSLPKPISHGLTTKERLDAYSEISKACGKMTSASFFEHIAKIPTDHERKQILIVITDGEFNADLNPRIIDKLLSHGWICYCLGIGYDAIYDIFGSNGSRIIYPSSLPSKLEKLIEGNI
ncbi:MAG: VWA domain-containing protein [Coriobacteriales bacterium]|jgi:hypothetical protein|nr:VWA domain-containing protein [Coriobacteriales bacterium]